MFPVFELPKYQPLTRVSQIPVEPFTDLSFFADFWALLNGE